MILLALLVPNSLEIYIEEPTEVIIEDMCHHWALSAVMAGILTMGEYQYYASHIGNKWGPGVCYIPMLQQVRCCGYFQPVAPDLPLPTPSISPVASPTGSATIPLTSDDPYSAAIPCAEGFIKEIVRSPKGINCYCPGPSMSPLATASPDECPPGYHLFRSYVYDVSPYREVWTCMNDSNSADQLSPPPTKTPTPGTATVVPATQTPMPTCSPDICPSGFHLDCRYTQCPELPCGCLCMGSGELLNVTETGEFTGSSPFRATHVVLHTQLHATQQRPTSLAVETRTLPVATPPSTFPQRIYLSAGISSSCRDDPLSVSPREAATPAWGLLTASPNGTTGNPSTSPGYPMSPVMTGSQLATQTASHHPFTSGLNTSKTFSAIMPTVSGTDLVSRSASYRPATLDATKPSSISATWTNDISSSILNRTVGSKTTTESTLLTLEGTSPSRSEQSMNSPTDTLVVLTRTIP